LLTGLINKIVESPQPFVLVLDDHHLIEASAIHDALAFLLDRMPLQMHLVLSTRADPRLFVARLRGRRQVSELTQVDLRFTVEEVDELVNGVVSLTLVADDVVKLAQRTEGWIAGLQMAIVSMRGRRVLSSFIRVLPGATVISSTI
jgi:LuxR family maltose regulon positive regulatory protein